MRPSPDRRQGKRCTTNQLYRLIAINQVRAGCYLQCVNRNYLNSSDILMTREFERVTAWPLPRLKRNQERAGSFVDSTPIGWRTDMTVRFDDGWASWRLVCFCSISCLACSHANSSTRPSIMPSTYSIPHSYRRIMSTWLK